MQYLISLLSEEEQKTTTPLFGLLTKTQDKQMPFKGIFGRNLIDSPKFFGRNFAENPFVGINAKYSRM